MFILGVAGAIFNVLLLAYSLVGPLSSDQELRNVLRSLFFEYCFFIGGAFALADARLKTAALAAIAGVIIHFLITRKRLSRLRRRRRAGGPDAK